MLDGYEAVSSGCPIFSEQRSSSVFSLHHQLQVSIRKLAWGMIWDSVKFVCITKSKWVFSGKWSKESGDSWGRCGRSGRHTVGTASAMPSLQPWGNHSLWPWIVCSLTVTLERSPTETLRCSRFSPEPQHLIFLSEKWNSYSNSASNQFTLWKYVNPGICTRSF